MTARVSASAPSGTHMWPEVRIIAGLEASTMTWLGTCRLVMPLSEFTIARRGPSARPCSMAALISSPLGRSARPSRMPPRPLLGDRPAASRSAPKRSKTSGRKARTTWPKMIGSMTFIIVALRCTENSTSCALARATCSRRKASRAATRMTVASTTSPSRTARPSLSTVVVPSVATCWIVRRSLPARTTTARWSGSRRRPWWRRWSCCRSSRRPSSGGGCGRSSSPRRAPAGRSCPRAARD
jgi:hypothetical protein